MVRAMDITDREVFLMVRLLTTAEMMRELSVSRPTLYAWRCAGMPYVPLGVRSVRYNLADVLEWLEGRKRLTGFSNATQEGGGVVE